MSEQVTGDRLQGTGGIRNREEVRGQMGGLRAERQNTNYTWKAKSPASSREVKDELPVVPSNLVP
jgi:hypothetical protein